MLHFESLIDPTHFGTVRRYLNCSRSPITDVLFVREERLLVTVAELLASQRPTGAQRTQFARWIRDGCVRVGITSTRLPDQADFDGLVDLEAIPDSASCRVLFLPPYYLVHLRTRARLDNHRWCPVNTRCGEV